jgi:glycosyltransferase involved in cell wall biosynthesis
MITAAMIVLNGGKTLERCLSSIRPHVDDIIIGIDSRTDDDTETIANRYNATTFPFEWKDDFSYARNLVADRVTTDWILVVDADDYISEVKGSLIPSDEYNGANVLIRTSDTTCLQSTRIYRKGSARYVGSVHELLKFSDPKIATLPVAISHERSERTDPGRNLRILNKAMDQYPRDLFNYGRESIDAENYEEGIKAMLIYVQISPSDRDKLHALKEIARAYHHQGNTLDAKKYCFLAIAQNENYQPAYVMLAKIAYEAKDWKQVVNWSLHALNLDTLNYIFDHTVRDTRLCYEMLSAAYFFLEQYETGLPYMERCVQLSPDDPQFQVNLKLYRDELEKKWMS